MSEPPEQGASLGATLRASPVVALWLLIACICLPVSLQLFDVVTPLLFDLFIVDPNIPSTSPMEGLVAVLERGQIWRLVSPVFLHFSVIHLVFNAVLFLILGVGLERRLGSLGFFLTLLVWAVLSNLAQLLYAGTPFFGGLSGVVTAMFAARLVLGFVRPHDPELRLHQGLIVSLFLSLIVFSTGVSQLFGLNVANTAHWAGFISGLLVGGLLHFLLVRQPELKSPARPGNGAD